MIDVLKSVSILFLIFTSLVCPKQDQKVLKLKIIDNKYTVTLGNIEELSIEAKPNSQGNPELIALRDTSKKIFVKLYIGTKNPIPDWKRTFDFEEKHNDIKSQIHDPPNANYINHNNFLCNGIKVRAVHYIQDNQLEKIESQFYSLDSIVVNAVYTRHVNSVDYSNLWRLNRGFLCSFSIEK